jgi:hypothetical protein
MSHTPRIVPTPGRVLWYIPHPSEGLALIGGDPLIALLAGVVDDRTVNVAVFNASGGFAGQRGGVPILEQGDDVPSDAGYCVWMPFQKGQAAKTDDLSPRITKLEESIAELTHRLDLATAAKAAELSDAAASQTATPAQAPPAEPGTPPTTEQPKPA